MQHLYLCECPERQVQKSAKQKRIFTVSSFKLWVRVCIAPLFLLHLKTLLGSGLFQGFLPFFPSSKSCHGHLPKHSDSISSTVNFLFSGVSENNNCCKKTNGRHAAYAAHNVNLLPFLKKKIAVWNLGGKSQILWNSWHNASLFERTLHLSLNFTNP